jgi:hypothetical protein
VSARAGSKSRELGGGGGRSGQRPGSLTRYHASHAHSSARSARERRGSPNGKKCGDVGDDSGDDSGDDAGDGSGDCAVSTLVGVGRLGGPRLGLGLGLGLAWLVQGGGVGGFGSRTRGIT